MGIAASVYSRPAKFSTIIADADLDIASHDLITTNMRIHEDGVYFLRLRNRADTNDRGFVGSTCWSLTEAKTDKVIENSAGNGITVDGLLIKDDKIMEMDGIGGMVMPKIASDNERNDHDAEITDQTGAVYVKQKTITFTNGVKGTLRVTFQIHRNTNPYTVYGRVYKNGVAIGAEQSCTNDNYEVKSEDIDVGTIAAGETLELWGKAEHASALGYWRYFKLFYDDDSGTVVTVNS